MGKKSQSYYLDKEVIEHLAKEADKEKRAASYYLNEYFWKIIRGKKK